MKVGLVVTGNVWFAPYLQTYTQILDNQCFDYDYISWNRDGIEKVKGFQYSTKIPLSSRVFKFIAYYKYVFFVKKVLKREKYDRVVFFGPQVPIFMVFFLRRRYYKKYILDYRDLSIDQNRILKIPFKYILQNSYANVISSPGFMKCIPQGFKYYISHNFDINKVKEAITSNCEVIENDNINVLTIGGIRNYSSNVEVINSLANKDGINLYFVGKGPAVNDLEDYVKKNQIRNVIFTGYYPKEDEEKYIKESSFLNIYYPSILSHSTAMSNRFYNSLIYKKPMIVTTNSIQGDYVETYNVGISIKSCENLYELLVEWNKKENSVVYSKRCNDLLKMFVQDYEELYGMLLDFFNIAK